MAKINVLPKNIAQLIAAGEVVERPASVIKELVENSIDAKASTITIEIQNGGIRYIRITDNGTGIQKDDVANAFKNHATSKITNAQDLDAIFTLGFRGEALASIAAVAKVQLLTKTQNETNGTRYVIEAGEEISLDEAGCPNGTTIVVRDLFFNTPARMKFMKRDVSEANAVADVIDKLALSHPEVSFRFIREGKQVLLTAGDSKQISAIHSVFSGTFAKDLIAVDYSMNGIDVTGYISKPMNSRASRSMQYFYLNNRFIKSRSCAMSMENAYKNMTMIGKFPICVLNISVSPENVDVNVHPAKTEVRFSDEKRVTSVIYYAVKTALEKYDTPIQVDLSKREKLIQKPQTQALQYEMANANKNADTATYKPKQNQDFWSNVSSNQFKSQLKQSVQNEDVSIFEDEVNLVKPANLVQEPPVKESQDKFFMLDEEDEQIDLTTPSPTIKNEDISEQTQVFYDTPFEQDEPDLTAEKSYKQSDTQQPEIVIKEKSDEPNLRLIGEVFKTFILCEYGQKMLLLDKHAAHERIIFNRLKSQSQGKIASQMLLIPITVTLSKNEYNCVMQNLEVFEKSGYGIDDFGDGSIIIRQMPAMLTTDDVENTVSEITHYLMQNANVIENEKIDHIYHTCACKAAIKAGNNSSDQELIYLVNQVISDDEVRYCPHGRPVLVELTKYELEKWFGRIK